MNITRRSFVVNALKAAGLVVAGAVCELPLPKIIISETPAIQLLNVSPLDLISFRDIQTQTTWSSIDNKSWVVFPEFINRQLRITPLTAFQGSKPYMTAEEIDNILHGPSKSLTEVKEQLGII